jgi:prolyl-tRNA synthetase
MRQSRLFTKTRKEAPSDEVAKNAALLIRGGFISKEMAGVYSFLPLGLRVMNKIVGVIREEMNKLGGVELHLAALQDPNVWEASGRWSERAVDNWFKTKVKVGGEVGLAFTHEEPLTRIMTEHVRSYKDLPLFVYQFQTKFRNETRAKSGILRGREFLMKDLYSFSRDEKEHEVFYVKAIEAYKKVFTRVGIGEHTYLTYASGSSFSKFSHEFQTVCEAGEDVIYIQNDDWGKGLMAAKGHAAVNKEIWTDGLKEELGLRGDILEKRAVEVGNIFTLGTRFSEALGLLYLDEKGVSRPVFMGSYGIGPGRLMGTAVELFADEKGIVWPQEIAPFRAHLISLAASEKDVKESADALYQKLSEAGAEVLYDDRDARAGEKFTDADLIGIPTRVVVSEKTIKEGKLEVKDRKTGSVHMLTATELLAHISS